MLVIAPIHTAPAATPVFVVDPTPQSVAKKCTADPACNSMILEGHGFVLPIPDLYVIIRGTGDNPEYPLTRSEVLAQEMCLGCRRKVEGKTFPTEATLKAMAGRVSANLRRIEAAEKAKAWQEREARKSKPRVHHTRVGEDMLDVIANSAKYAERLAKRQKHGRLPAAERRRLAATKSSRAFTSAPSKNGKKKDGGKSKGRK